MTRKRLVVGFCAFVLLGALGALGLLRLSEASRSLRAAERAVEVAADALKDGRIEDARSSLDEAEEEVLGANESLRSSLSLTLMSKVPVIDQNLDSLTTSVDIAATVIHGGKRLLEVSEVLESPDGTLEVSLSDGSIPIEAVQEAQVEVNALLDRLVAAGDPSESPLLLPATKQLRDAVDAEVQRRETELERVSRGLTLLDALVGGGRTRRFLIAVANTAEMRGSGGMMLNYGVLEGRAGTVDLVGFGRVEELVVGTPLDPASVGLPDDYVNRWDGFDVTREWRNATMSADLSLVAPVLRAMYQRATGLQADGVIQVDPHGLADILEAVGPVEVEEVGQVTAENVEALVLHDAYREFPGVEQRTDVLGNVAEAAFRRLVDGEFGSVRDLVSVLAAAIEGRHLAVSLDNADAQAALRSFGADGSFPTAGEVDAVHLTVQNMSGNKLDYFVDTHLEIVGDRPVGDFGTWRAEVTISNNAPEGEDDPQYIFGPFDETQEVGNYRGAVTLYLPAGASLQSFHADDAFRLQPVLQSENNRPLVGFWLDVPAGRSRTVVLDIRLPPRASSSTNHVLLIPSARVRPTTAVVRIAGGDVAVSAEVVLDRSWMVGESAPPTPLRGI